MEVAMAGIARDGATRRDTLKAGGAGLAALALPTAAAAADAASDAPPAPHWLTLLGRSDPGGRDETPAIEGRLPDGLAGVLYRNGPGLFERGGVRKPHLLDGDGLVQRLAFADGKAHYRNAFVATEKFVEEQAAGRYRHATWSMRKPGGMLANLGGGSPMSQAGVTVYPFRDALYAFDELSPPYRLDPETLATTGRHGFGDPAKPFETKAHTKFDPVSGDWLMFGVTHGRKMEIHALVVAADGTLKAHHAVESPRQVYIHDFFATESHFVVLLHPMRFSPWGFLAGLSSYIDSLRWEPESGNLVMVLPRAGGAPKYFEAPGAFMWHALNAYDEGGEIVADFVGYDAPDHFMPHDALLYRLMDGRLGTARALGTLRRYRIGLATGHLRAETVDAGGHEFPMVDPRVATRRHRIGYLSAAGRPALNSAVARVDLDTGKSTRFDFGDRAVAGEPVFAPRPGGGADEGWLIVQVHDGATETTVFAVLDAARVEDGPLARVRLPHPLPISFHGWWQARG
jgi:all-trans-8'-apo-beta-carotenal 15,15'-oxygenase